MKKKPKTSIFDEAAKRAGKKKKIKKKSIKTAPTAQSTKFAKPVDPPSDKEVMKIFKKIRDMESDLDKKMNTICELSGMSKGDLNNYIDNPENFTPEQWEEAQKQKEVLEKQLFKKLGSDTKKKFRKKKKIKIAKERRGKTLGARKGWIQM